MLQLIHITEASADLEQVVLLFQEYAADLNENLCFQSFDAELQDPLKKYGPPNGALYLAYWNQEPAGCIALQPLTSPGICEMKRLYLKPAYRKLGLGKLLVSTILNKAIELGYRSMRLDTLEKLQPAIRLYESYGFIQTNAYYENPLEGVVYMEKLL